MKVLVTGSSGFIGSHLCRALIEKGNFVRAFHRSSSNLRLLQDLPVEHTLGDLTQPETIKKAVEDIDAIFHTAAHLGPRAEAGAMYAVTVEGTRLLLNAAEEAGVKRIVYTSSAAALGIPETPPSGRKQVALMDENHSWNLRPEDWPQAYSKYLAEREVQKAVARGLDVITVNPTNVLGAGDVYRRSSSLVVWIARHTLPGMIEGGVNVVHIQDVVSGHLAALEKGKKGERYILGGENISLRELITLICQTAGVTAPQTTLPSGLLHSLSRPLRLFRPFIKLPISSELFNLAGKYFYYNVKKSQIVLGLDHLAPAAEAVQDAYEWFVQAGAIPRKSEPDQVENEKQKPQ